MYTLTVLSRPHPLYYLTVPPHTHFTLYQVDELEEGSLNAIRLYPASVDAPTTNSSQRDAMTAVDAIQSSVRGVQVYK